MSATPHNDNFLSSDNLQKLQDTIDYGSDNNSTGMSGDSTSIRTKSINSGDKSKSTNDYVLQAISENSYMMLVVFPLVLCNMFNTFC